MELAKAIHNRRSVRKFLDKPVEAEAIKKIIEAGVQAPSACNLQDWKFRILSDDEKARLVGMGAGDFIRTAPTAIIVAYSVSIDNYHDGMQSAAACIQNMLLTATELNLGSCWICHLPPKWRVQRLLNIPYRYDIIACVVLGYASRTPQPVPRKHKYAELFTFEKKGGLKLRSILKYLYMRQPIRPKIIEKMFTKRFGN